jgi:WD40 repeat protein
LQHEHWVQAVAFSPDGRTVLTGSVDSTARLWDVATGNALGTSVRQAGLNAVAFSHDGQLVLIGGEDKTARLCRTSSGLPVGPPLKHRYAVNAVAFSPDGQRILTGAGAIAQLWEVATGRPIGSPLCHQNTVVSVAFSPDGKTLLTGSDDKTARLWEAATGRELCPPMQHRDRITSVAFGPDGKTVLTGCWDKTAQMWEAATGRPIGQTLQLPEVVYVVAYSPDAQTLLTACWDQTVRLWNAPSFRPIGPPLRMPRSAWSAAFTNDGQGMLIGGMDFMARLWDTTTGRPIGPPWEHQGGVFGLATHPDGKSILTCSEDRTARMWRMCPPLTGTPEQSHQALAVLTGIELDSSGVVHWLEPEAWERYRRQLDRLPDAPWQREQLLPSALTWHTVQASEAEHQGKTFAALWHLEHLGVLEPNNWFWYARRAYLHLLAGQRQQAEAEDARARACCSGPEMENWYRQQLADCQLANRWQTALWYADRLLAALPRDGDVYAARSDIHTHLALPIPAAADLARAVELGAAPSQISFLTRSEAVTKRIGLIADWLILAPLPLQEKQSGVEGLDQDQLSGEAGLRPSAGDKIRVGGTELAWSKHCVPSGFMIDFNVLLGRMTNQSVAYAVCYLVVGEERAGLSLLVGSDDESKIYLNGKEIYRCAAARAHHEDEDTVENVTLRKGTNVLVFKVINETAEWRGSIRVVDRSGQPARGIKVSLTPQGK